MRFKFYYCLGLTVLLYNCNNKGGTTNYEQEVNSNPTTAITETHEENTVIVNCDTLQLKNSKATLYLFGSFEDEDSNNTIFMLTQNGKTIIHDSIISNRFKLLYKDFTGDSINDLLIHHYTGTRSNEFYNLYITDTLNNRLKRIKGFEKIPNPRYDNDYNLITCYGLTGTNYVKFYHIENDTILDYGITVEDDLMPENNFEERYRQAVNKIKTKQHQ
ncbi:XAC2610-related protein [Flavobacterium sp. C4GT6]|uniref:XAC2610-related protein n=1 Tax=Flavobacterium sp. C4GT6 TaxID=3103818 RepID=UPI002ED5AC16